MTILRKIDYSENPFDRITFHDPNTEVYWVKIYYSTT
jgi:hypothetical protein